MGLTGCYRCLKYLVLLLNLIFWLAGIAILAVALWIYFDSRELSNVVENVDSYYIAVYICIAVGAVMTIVGFIGCCGALRESQCMLGTFFVLLVVVLLAQIGAAVCAYMNIDKLKVVVEEEVLRIIEKRYPDDAKLKAGMDGLQENFYCCGADGPTDWKMSKLNGYDSIGGKVMGAIKDVKDTLIGEDGDYIVPKSCCRTAFCRDTAGKDGYDGGDKEKNVYGTGCIEALENFVLKHRWVFIGTAIGVIVVELFGLLFSLVLCCAVKRTEDYEYK